MKIFLGGTCAKSTWRDDLIPHLTIPYFNPVVEDWTETCIAIEEREKEICDIHLYVITSEMEGVYSIAEAVQSSHTKNTIFCVIEEGFSKSQIASLKAVCGLIEENGQIGFSLNGMKSLINSIEWVTKQQKEN